jgi:putative transposase
LTRTAPPAGSRRCAPCDTFPGAGTHNGGAARIQQVFADYQARYGSPKITAVLRQAGDGIAQKTVARLMRELGLPAGVYRRRPRSRSTATPVEASNQLNQPCVAERPHPVWMADITYCWTAEGWLFLATIEDLYSRMIVGWAMGARMTEDLVLRALDQAVHRYQPPRGVLHHSDRGSQYTSAAYQARLRAYGMQTSFSRAGHCDDNACIESWHSLLKKELLYQHRWATRDEAQHAIFTYIEIFYNRQRLHSALGYRTPQAMLDQALAGGLTPSAPGGLPAVKAGEAADRLP